MNRRGQIDQIITGSVVIVVVFFLMALFVIASSNIGSIVSKGSSAHVAVADPILTKLVTVKIDENKKEVTLLEALILENEGTIELEDIRPEINSLLTTEGECFILELNGPSSSQPSAYALFEYDDKFLFSGDLYMDQKFLTKASFEYQSTESVKEVSTYYGRCIYD